MSINLTNIRIKAEKEKIIKMYKDNIPILDIAKKYGVVSTSLWRHLKKWGVPIKRKPREPHHYRDRKIKRVKRIFSLELLAKMKENTRINDKHIKFYGIVETEKDKFMVRNILKKSKAVANE